jgi:methionyl-tRNA synthetase
LEEGKCPYHKTKIEKIKEESYFFKLSKYKNKLLKLYKEHPEFILPKERRNEIINRVQEELQDLSITRKDFSWGIPFPFDKKHVIYVWFDALLNYLSGSNGNWPADLHLLGKDNGWFHAVIWPAMLLSAGYKLPKTVFIHGFLTFNKNKISKSLGNVISPNFLIDKYGADSVRYSLLRCSAFEDSDYSEEILVERHNNELANKLGNLVSRVAALAEKYGTQKSENKLLKQLKLKEIERNFEEYKLDRALNEIFAFIDICNEYVQNKKPWETHDKKILYELAESIKEIAKLLFPFIPETSEKITKQFTGKIKKGEILFRKV